LEIQPYTGAHYLAALSGALPALAAMLFFDWLDRRRPEPLRLRYAVAGLGMLSVIPVLIIAATIDGVLGSATPSPGSYAYALYVSFVIAAGIEEACKISAVYLVAWKHKAFDERMDGLVYGARAGLGFALVENCLYIYQAAIDGQLVVVWVLRALLAVPGHALWSGMMGYFAARHRFDKAGPGPLGGYLIAVALHGVYDAAIFLQVPLRDDGHDTAAGLLLLVPIVVTIVGWKTIRVISKRALALDDAAAMRRAA
jgi:RsiW-degrading membrane proteinase PrsW (M82 family)